MDDFVCRRRKELVEKVATYVKKHNINTITIPVYDFFIMLQAVEDVCNEWGAAPETKEFESQIYKKYMGINS